MDNSYRYKNVEYLNNTLPENDWLSGDDFVEIVTDNSVIKTNINNIVNKNYILTQANNTDASIEISGMENFKFFDKKIDRNGIVKLNVCASGYLFFESVLDSVTPSYPIAGYDDTANSDFYKQVTTTDAIQLNTIIDIRKHILAGENDVNGNPIYNVSYAVRPNEFIIRFFGKTTRMLGYSKYSYDNTANITNTDFSLFAIRIDKINSAILIYTKRLGETQNQKIFGLRRTDGYNVTIKDSARLNLNKPSGLSADKDFVIGVDTNYTGPSKPITNTEYILFLPRFETTSDSDEYVSYIYNKDYDRLKDDFKIGIFKTFKHYSLSTNIDTVEDASLTLGNVYSLLEENSDLIFIPYDSNIIPSYSYDKNAQFKAGQSESIVSRSSFFHNGTFKGKVWDNGIFVNGLISNNDLVWKYGIKHNGTFEGGYELNKSAHWLGGFHISDINDTSFIRNLVWYRGIFNGGTWDKGHWLALDLNMEYEYDSTINNDWSIFKRGEWYSRLDQVVDTNITNLFKDGDNGTFNSGTISGWNLTKPPGNNHTIIESGDYSLKINRIGNTTGYGNSFTNPTLIFNGSSNILVERNTKYKITARVSFDNSSFVNTSYSAKLGVISNSDILNIKDIGYESKYTTGGNNLGKWYIIDNTSPLYTLDDGVYSNKRWIDITKEFDSLENDGIQIGVYCFENSSYSSNYSMYIDSIEMIGKDLTVISSDPYKIENHDSVWHGGTWESLNKLKSDNTYYPYTYQNDVYKTYRVKNNTLLNLPEVTSIWLGGLWLRGIFNGGIFANGFWHSTDSNPNISGSAYNSKIGANYNINYSLFKQGEMMNSIWEGGRTENNIDSLDVIFGDLVNSYDILVDKNNSADFKWTKDYALKRSTGDTYSSPLFGRNYFIGYHNDPLFDGSDTINNIIEINRIRKQYNEDGVMSVYWKRGEFNNGLFQFSHFDSILAISNSRVEHIGGSLSGNSTFKGLIYSSLWKNGLFYASATDDSYPLLDVDKQEPRSLFYYSVWEKGYWNAIGLDNDSETPLDTNDGIQISNALFSRSLWNAGIWEGGIFDLSVWRCGVYNNNTNQIFTTYKTRQIELTKGNPDSLSFTLDIPPLTKNDFEYGDTGIKVIPEIRNNMDFFINIVNLNIRYAGGIDNLASIWVNGTMRGSVWHGGIWQRGMFKHKDLTGNMLDMYGNIPDNDNKYQLGIWTRGIWLSGYFSSYDDKKIKKDPLLLNTNSHLTNDYSLNRNNNEGRRCLFFAIKASSLTDPTNLLGMNDTAFSNYINEANNVDSSHNYSSFFSRRLLKESATQSYNVAKPYWSQFNGSFINGVIYASSNSNEFLTDEKRMIFSLYSTISNKYLDAKGNGVNGSNVIANSDSVFFKNFKTSSLSTKLDIPFGLATPMWSSTTNEWVWTSTTQYNFINNGILQKQGVPNFIENNSWRHNIDESTVGLSYGDGTLTNLITENLDSDDNLTRVSIAQGSGIKWISDESEGEPKYKSDDTELNFELIIIDFDDNDFYGDDYQVV